MKTIVTILLAIASLCACKETTVKSPVYISGAMKNVMMGGDLSPTIDLDTIRNKANLYGVGPADSLRGELLIDNGIVYRSVVEDKVIRVDSAGSPKAPFFVYSFVRHWSEHPIPDSVKSLSELENLLDKIASGRDEPFAFTLSGTVSAEFHVVDLPSGMTVVSPADVSRNQTSVRIEHTEARIVGFFSRKHQSVFTHHDSYVHLHLITGNENLMGHVDALRLSQASRLFLPF